MGDVLIQDVGIFRSQVVTYARDHRESLDEKFGAETISQLIDGYLREDEAGFFEWSGPEVWWIAARVVPPDHQAVQLRPNE